jgi:hypothetical protein
MYNSVPLGQSPAAETMRVRAAASRFVSAFQKAEIEKWWPIIKTAGVKGE